MTPRTKTVLTVLAATLSAPVLITLIAIVINELRQGYNTDDLDFTLAILILAPIYWAFFTGRLRWLWTKV